MAIAQHLRELAAGKAEREYRAKREASGAA